MSVETKSLSTVMLGFTDSAPFSKPPMYCGTGGMLKMPPTVPIDVGLGQAAGQNAGQVASLRLVEDEALVVRKHLGRVALAEAGGGDRIGLRGRAASSTQMNWSMPTKFTSGFALAAIAVSAPRAKP